MLGTQSGCHRNANQRISECFQHCSILDQQEEFPKHSAFLGNKNWRSQSRANVPDNRQQNQKNHTIDPIFLRRFHFDTSQYLIFKNGLYRN